MREKLARIFQGFSERGVTEEQSEHWQHASEKYADLISRAHEEWQAARALFESVSDPDLVDHAIALITATEKKYTYLLRQAKIEGAGGRPY